MQVENALGVHTCTKLNCRNGKLKVEIDASKNGKTCNYT